ncbi:rRNA (guanine-N1)-methyltransferase [Shewanella submarina]|uniref:Pilus assembly protein n=1 Tax=Shewanella submarina TaxID=2016376 RepID=A0ABV7GFB6_9GAMM|nr:PilC/PilY family type IV pilus protein [Shewanella submarina]MCL1036870.1 rRNA (guanine-N1)-methyltransferase [Shewanella submarina]
MIASACFVGGSFADDTELYVFESSVRAGARPQVLIIFDNSGSMRTIEQNAEAPYDSDTVYPAIGSDNSYSDEMIYFTKGGIDSTSLPTPDSPSESRRFLAEINGCETSKSYLEDYGVFTGFFREYTFKGQNGTWEEVPDNEGANITVIDCFDDIDAGKWGNAPGQPSGFPIDSEGTKQNPVLYTSIDGTSTEAEKNAALEKARLTGFGTGQPLTLYTDNYLRWYHGDKETVPRSRIDIAKDVIKNTIVTTPGVDFGLAVFNINAWNEGDADGGRIVAGIDRLDEASKIDLLDTIGGLDPETNTPLCETLYEAKQYFAGEAVTFGDKDAPPSNYNYQPNTPPRDTSIENHGVYISPFKNCQNQAYVVYITDGVPTVDANANHLVKGLPSVDTTAYVDDALGFSSYLPNLAEWMYTQDINQDDTDDKQTVKTYTIGFSEGAADAAELLSETAERGGGKYFAAKSATDLSAALQQVFSEILEVNASFTSPSIASNNFDRTLTFDSVYYAMFLPNKGPRWRGNLKKFKVTGGGDIVDANGNAAIADDGNLKSSACSFWTSSGTCSGAPDGGDGNDVRTGGAAESLTKQSTRKLYSNLGAGGTLLQLTSNNAASTAGSSADLAAFMGITEGQLPDTFAWLYGTDVDDDNQDKSTTDTRGDIMGDPLHSKPLAINFGTSAAPDIRVIMGTNHGFLHMFKDAGETVSESWAFMPYELLPNVAKLRANVPTGVHSIYGMDSSPVAYVKTGPSGIEKAWLFVGMRRGGKSYYAIDITNPDSPTLMWKVDPDSKGMAELGQTWAEPVVTMIPGWPAGNTDAATAKPVLVIGGGYSPSTKDNTDLGSADSMGRAVFVLDAETGAMVHSFGTLTEQTYLNGLTDSIPNSVAVLDSNSDHLTDRIYATDTGGNVWRIDMPGAYPSSSEKPWTAFKFAALGSNTNTELDRRFFSEPAVAQTVFTNISQITVTEGGTTTSTKTYQNVPYDAVVVGSGLRPNPSDKSRSDKFFALQDRNVVTRSFTGTPDNPLPAPLFVSTLYDVTQNAPAEDDEAANILFGQKRGWYYSFKEPGEKSLAGATIVQGKVFFTSYVPGDSSAANTCLVEGLGKLYAFDLHKGTRTYSHEYLEVGERVPDTPQLVVPPNGDNPSYMYLIGIGKAGAQMEPLQSVKGCADGDNKCVGGGLGANRIYYHIEE